jgi:dihydropteroate synthase
MTDLVRTRTESTPRQRPRIMGILNVTPDSFSDGGRYPTTDAAVEHAQRLVAAGADLIDVGGESTRPGAGRVPVEQEIERVVPVIRRLAELRIGVSIDTMNAATARAAVEAGAEIINDVSGGLADPDMLRLVAETGVTYILMHWRGHSAEMQQNAEYGDVVQEVRDELKSRVAEAIVWGVKPRSIVLDPGLGFAKNAGHNWQLLGHLPALATLGYPILIGASRKRFLGDLLPPSSDGSVAAASDRDRATAVVSALAAQAGVWGVRVHDVAETRAALDVWEHWERGAAS